jgi:glycosyltransferase involved in cell wall biosynthesis
MSLSILQVATGFPNWGGTELHILNLSQQLSLRGHDVTIACRPGRWVETRAKQMGLQTVPISVMRQHDWQDFGKLRHVLRERKIQILHAHWSLDTVVPGFAALAEHVPVRVLSRHMPYPFKNRIGTLLYSRLLFTRMVSVSNSVRATLVGCGVREDLVETIHHGTDVEAFERTTATPADMRRELGIPEESVAIGIVGRVAPEKGHAVLLDAIKQLDSKTPVTVVVIGNGPDDDIIRAKAAQLRISDRVIFVGFREDINNAISALDIVTVPSTWNEPCSAVVQQAMALSKPLIGTRTGGTPEMVLDGETGLLVPPSDAAALANAIKTLSENPDLRSALGVAGRQRVERLFSLKVMTDKIEDLYRREMGAARGADTWSAPAATAPSHLLR